MEWNLFIIEIQSKIMPDMSRTDFEFAFEATPQDVEGMASGH
jgi:hypothetical protein